MRHWPVSSSTGHRSATHIAFFASAILAASLSFTGCDYLGLGDTAELWTSIPEVAAYVEVFNGGQDEYRVELVFDETPGRSLSSGQDAPDIIIGRDLDTVQVQDTYRPLDRMIDKEMIKREIFYPQLFERGIRDEKLYLLPVSFNLPALMFSADAQMANDNAFFLSLESIRERCGAYNQFAEPPLNMGFSPQWEPEALLVNAYHFGVSFDSTPTGDLVWDDNALQMSVAYVRDWTASVNEGPENQDYFAEKYLYDPGFRLIDQGRILYYYTDSDSFLDIPADAREKLEFRWLAKDSLIPVLDDVVHAAIPRTAKNRKAAFAFLTWFYTPETQQKLLEDARYKRIRTFGIADGFSAVRTVNDRYYPREYPFLVGKLPPSEYLQFPEPRPRSWYAIKDEVILPWLAAESRREEPGTPLAQLLKEWNQQRPSG